MLPFAMATSMPVRLRIFSLNCWGIRYMSKYCVERYAMIGEVLSREHHDIVLLQEVWSEKDYLFLKKTLACCHPYSYYFKSGVIGSGLAVFSKHRIHEAFLYRYSLNGYPYMAHHGDWFGGKAVGLVHLNISGLKIHVYVTHLHAEYCREKDSYLPHRVVQAWELQHFVRHTSSGADVVILGGDLNMHPQDLGSRLVWTYTGLKDCYTETEHFDGCENGITLISDNPFINKAELGPFEKGIRIDYILFKGSGKVDVKCESLSTTKGSISGKPFPLSDHEALSAQLLLMPVVEVRQDRDNELATDNLPELVDIVNEVRTEVKVGLHCTERKRHTAARTGFMGVVLLLLELAIAMVPWLALAAEQPFPRASFYLLGALCFAILLSTSMLYLFYTTELKALQGAEDQMRLAIGSLQEKLKTLETPQKSPARCVDSNTEHPDG
ncbi:sphingomyelin phosphodiesterase 2 [Denticeps clupeoides]|uniref:Sphingomyelin phosphodiesterase 2 n=1 Tax=Denticeps clupeoides TaxID=299321 RepID=A0AAY4EVK1_9TELE|nr:sphingomyelin phosphodiesterase 2-like [Denticeps clupeoides]XP_028855259.1 sphingomyelin phosphodiesterase 2-like [Denticeps clupeoides]